MQLFGSFSARNAVKKADVTDSKQKGFIQGWRKKLLIAGVVSSLLAINQTANADIFSSFLSALSQIIQQGFSSSSSSSVGAIGQLLNELINTHSTESGPEIQNQYVNLQSQQMEQTAAAIKTLTAQGLIQQFSAYANTSRSQRAAYKAINNSAVDVPTYNSPGSATTQTISVTEMYCTVGDNYQCSSTPTPNSTLFFCENDSSTPNSTNNNCYSPTSSSSLFGSDNYTNSAQQAAAYIYLQNASGALLGIQKPDPNWNWKHPSQAVLAYNSFYQTITSLQSLAANNLANSYAERIPQGNNVSLLQQYRSMLEGNVTTNSYWSEINNLPIIGQLAMIVYQLPSIMITLSRITDQLEQIKDTLAAMNVSNALLSQMSFGQQLYSAAQQSQSSNTKNQSKTYTVPDKQSKDLNSSGNSNSNSD